MANELTINPKTVYSELQKLKPQIESALPRHMTPDRMARIALTQLRVNPALFNCTPESFYGAIIAASQLGLEPGVNGQCYLIPYKNTCTLVPGWKGLMDLVSRAGRASAWTGVVRKGDFFEYKLGSNPKLLHEPADDDMGDFTHVYAVGWVRDAQWPIIEVWSRAKVNKHLRQYNKVGDRHYALQNENNLEMYGRKVALLQVIKYLPSSIELRDAAMLDESAAEGKQTLTIEGALQGDVTGGGPSEELAEIEVLMERLGWPQNKRYSFRQTYSEKLDAGLLYLRDEIKKTERVTMAAPPNGAPAPAQASATAPAAQQATQARRRGPQPTQTQAAPAPEPEPQPEPAPEQTGEPRGESGTQAGTDKFDWM